MTIWKDRRWTTTDNKAIEISVWYHEPDDFNDKRGYGISVYPVEIDMGMITAECYAGYKMWLFDVARKTSKSNAKAFDMAQDVMNEMIEKVCFKNNLKLEY